MDINLRDIRYFLETARLGKVAEAAQSLNITQPSLSVALKRLEQEFGAELFLRSKSGVKLTGAGKTLRDQGLLLMDMATHTRELLDAESQGVSGQLILGCHPSVGLYSLPHFLPLLNKAYPELNLHLVHGGSREIGEKVIQGDVEVGLVINPVPHPDLVIKKLLKDEVTFFYRKNASWKSKELSNRPWAYDQGLLQVQSVIKKASREGIKAAQVIQSSNLENLVKIGESSDCLIIAPQRVVSASSKKKLYRISGAPVFYDELALVYRQEFRKLMKVQAAREIIEKGLKES